MSSNAIYNKQANSLHIAGWLIIIYGPHNDKNVVWLVDTILLRVVASITMPIDSLLSLFGVDIGVIDGN
ncbi:22187_t:CDS:2 [Gigaspora margarita]|uniref:22187_t:CDS:1 n=1 Tax=Gigaspora margarita TaxID=4874 RepID=A0ABN7UVT7_GIGMA|nr:22187_t:CDS:2 [Gigaspora margarita]